MKRTYRWLALVPALVLGVNACERAAPTEVVPAATPTRQAALPAPSASLSLTGNTGINQFTICSVGAAATYAWSATAWSTANYSGAATSGSTSVADGGTTGDAAWASGSCQVAYSYPAIQEHAAAAPQVTATYQGQAGIQLDSIVRDSLTARNLTRLCGATPCFTGPTETLNTLTGTSTVSGAVNNDAGEIVFFYFTKLPSLSLAKTADAGTVQAGSAIGFTMTATNAGPGVAKAVVLTDVLPVGAGLSWSVSPANAACSIASGTLSCSFGDLAAGANAGVHISSPTTAQSCAVYSNTASTQATGTGAVTASASTTVECPPSLSLIKTADAASVSAGSSIGFTMTVSNAGPGSAASVTLSDPLPTGTGISWSISPANAACSISSGVLSCGFGTLTSGSSATVHVTSTTTAGSCATYSNTATAQATGATPVQASASEQVTCTSACGTFTIGYWKTHAGFGPQGDVVTPLLPVWLGTAGGAKSVQVTTAAQAVTLLQMSGAPSNPVNKLYAQLLAARLSIVTGVDGSAVAAVIAQANAFLATHNASSTLTKAEASTVNGWATTLDNYNNGIIGPGHCQ